jgi:ethanolamine permease
LVILAMGVMVFAGGAGDWRALSNINDPLPQAMKMIVGENSNWLHMLVWIGLFGLIASFHGIILGYSRQIFALARAGFMPAYFSVVNEKFKTPHRALIAGAVVGIAAILSDDLQFNGMTLTANLITMAVFGAIVMYIVSMMSLFSLRKKEPLLERPFMAIAYPAFPAIALGLAVICLLTMIYFNPQLALLFAVLMALAFIYFSLTQHHRDASADNAIATTA